MYAFVYAYIYISPEVETENLKPCSQVLTMASKTDAEHTVTSVTPISAMFGAATEGVQVARLKRGTRRTFRYTGRGESPF